MRSALLRGACCIVTVSAIACGSSKGGSASSTASGSSGGSAHTSASSSGSSSSAMGGASTTASAGSNASTGGAGGSATDTSTTSTTGASGTSTSSGACASVDAGTAAGVVAGMVPGPGTFVSGCAIFPADNAWNVQVDSPSIATTTKYTGIPLTTHLHPDLGGWTSSGPYGIPYNVVPSTQPNVSITFNQYANQSDPGPGGWTTNPNGGSTGVTAYPIPNNPEIEGAPGAGQIVGDDHLLVLQQAPGGSGCGCVVWESWQTAGGTMPPWTAANGVMWDLGTNALRPLGWTSADAAGLSIFAGLLKFEEVKAGVVTHAIRMTFNTTQKGYVFPATHSAGSTALGGTDPPMGLRLRLKASFDTSSFSGPGKIVATAMKTYGLIVADNGSDWFFGGDSNNGWDDNDPNGDDTYVGELLTDFDKVTGADFDVLDTGAPVNTGE